MFFLISRMQSDADDTLTRDEKTPKDATHEYRTRILDERFNAISFYYTRNSGTEKLIAIRHWVFSPTERQYDQVWHIGKEISRKNANILIRYFKFHPGEPGAKEISILEKHIKLIQRVRLPTIPTGRISPIMMAERKIEGCSYTLPSGEIILNSRINIAKLTPSQRIIFLDPLNTSEILEFCPQDSMLMSSYNTKIQTQIQTYPTLNKKFQFLIDTLRGIVKFQPETDQLTRIEEIVKTWSGRKIKIHPTFFEPVIPLDHFIQKAACCCRHHALAMGYFIARLIQENNLPSTGEVFYYHNDIRKNRRHAWVIYRENTTLIMIDRMWNTIFDLTNETQIIQAKELYGANPIRNILRRFHPAHRPIQITTPPKSISPLTRESLPKFTKGGPLFWRAIASIKQAKAAASHPTPRLTKIQTPR